MLHEKLTESDVRKIQEEIEHRKLVIRKEALESVKEARAHGDLSENFEYKAAKQYKNKNEQAPSCFKGYTDDALSGLSDRCSGTSYVDGLCCKGQQYDS
jgi:hypothetical protein